MAEKTSNLKTHDLKSFSHKERGGVFKPQTTKLSRVIISKNLKMK